MNKPAKRIIAFPFAFLGLLWFGLFQVFAALTWLIGQNSISEKLEDFSGKFLDSVLDWANS
jgi:hypothetical protein